MKKILICLMALLVIFVPYRTDAKTPLKNAVGMNISAFSSTTLLGEPVDADIFNEKGATILHYFATWSADCIREISYMQRASEEFESEISVYGLLHEDATSTPEAAIQLLSEEGAEYSCLRLDNVLTELVETEDCIPQTFLVSSGGIVVAHFSGTFSSYSVLERFINDNIPATQVYHDVEFVDGHTQEIIETQSIPHGGNALPPSPPSHSGYVFIGWYGDYNNIVGSRTIVAIYDDTDTDPIPGDVDCNGRVTIADVAYVTRYAMGLPGHDFVEYCGDVNGNNAIEVADALMIMRIAISPFA